MSPELLTPERFGACDSRPTKQSDCYALGTVVYEVRMNVIFSALGVVNKLTLYQVLCENPPYWDITNAAAVTHPSRKDTDRRNQTIRIVLDLKPHHFNILDASDAVYFTVFPGCTFQGERSERVVSPEAKEASSSGSRGRVVRYRKRGESRIIILAVAIFVSTIS